MLYSLPADDRIDETSPPVSLFEAFTTDSTKGAQRLPSLGDRFRLAAALAIGFLELHTVEWLHKNFNSQNVLLFRSSDGAIVFSKPFIVGFDFARPDKRGEVSLSMRASPFDLYRHPEVRHPRPSPNSSQSLFKKHHDIYSLGMVLFEIGMWSRLDRYTKPNLTADDFRQRVRGYVKKSLSMLMGDHFCRAVDACLSGEYLSDTGTISLDMFSGGGEETDILSNDPDVTNSAELDCFCRRIVAELCHCHCEMGSN